LTFKTRILLCILFCSIGRDGTAYCIPTSGNFPHSSCQPMLCDYCR